MSIYGIDLGTTYSCIAKLDNAGNPVIIKNFDDNSDWVASAVYFKEGQEECIVGEGAKEASLIHPGRVVEFAKRYIGRKGELTRNFEIDGKVYEPEDISAMVLKRIVTYAKKLGEDVQDVIITCPAYFDFAQREATKLAGTYAGLNVIDTVNEPTAAALSYCHRQFEENQTILIYDLGGGTFDVSILQMSVDANGRQILTVLATTGDDRLGGKEWDDSLFKIMVKRYCDENGVEYSDETGPAEGELDLEILQIIKNSVETLKKKLSTEEDSSIKVYDAGIRTSIKVSRREFEEKTSHLVDRTMGYLEQALKLARNPDIDLVLLVGGSTFMPRIREVLEARFPGIVRLEDPNLAVAKGAAVLGSMLDIGRDWEKIAAIIDAQNEANKKDGTQQDLTEEQLMDVFKEEIEKQGITVPENFNPDDYISGSKGANPSTIGRLPPILEETSPRSLGPAVLVNGEYLIDNLVKMGDKLPFHINKPYYTPRDNMAQIRLPLYQSLSREEYVVPDVDREGTPRQTDPALDVKRFDKYLILPLPPGMPADSVILLDFQVTKSGVIMKVRNPLDNKEENVEYSFYEEVSEEEIKNKQQELGKRAYVSDI